MYMTPIGSFSGVLHLVAKRPYILAAVAVVAVAVTVPATPPPPPSTPHVPAPEITYTAPTPTEPCQVEVPEPTQPGIKPRQIGNCYFNYSAPGPKARLAARVDNVCKHKLDDTILYLKSNKAAIVLEGNSLSGHGTIGLRRAENVKAYLIRNGIAADRISITRGEKHSRVVDLIVSGS
jgi:hypothetical protein